MTRRLIDAFVNGAAGGPARAEGQAAPVGEAAAVGRRVDDALADLTPREREVLALVGRGMTNQEIAGHLVLSPLTAKTHVSRLFVKLRVRDRAQLVVLAYETGLVGS